MGTGLPHGKTVGTAVFAGGAGMQEKMQEEALLQVEASRENGQEPRNSKKKKEKGSHRTSGILWGFWMFFLGLLFICSITVTGFCGIGTGYLLQHDLLFADQETVQVSLETEWGQDVEYIARKILFLYLNYGFKEAEAYCKGTNISYSIHSIYGRKLGGNLRTADEKGAVTCYFTARDLKGYPEAAEYFVRVRLDLYEGEEGDSLLKEWMSEKNMAYLWGEHRKETVGGLALGIVISVILLLVMTGQVVWRGRHRQSLTGRIPVEIVTALTGLLFYWLIWHLIPENDVFETRYLRWIAEGVTAFAVLLLYCLHFARRMQAENWYRCSILWFLYHQGCRMLHVWKALYRNLNLLWKMVLLAVILSMGELAAILLLLPQGEKRWIFMGLWFLEKVILTSAALYYSLSLAKLQEAAHEVAEGNFEYKLKLGTMPGALKTFGADMNSLTDSISVAVEERLRSERLKTELITNVSHDIKTPLTSIINFSDLIAKEKCDNPKVMEYAEHLHKQSTRLKKLIEDLMEASRASTGNLETNPEICDVRVLLGQCLGEYEPRLQEHQLELIVKACQEPVWIMADTRMLWRVFDNLMNNICKYGQPDTRVYLSTEQIQDRVRITFKNVSKYALDVSPEDLMERFVRGDLSRHTEGNGLGLSIVRSLMELQKGSIELAVDGDLFKVILEFPVTAAEAEKADYGE